MTRPPMKTRSSDIFQSPTWVVNPLIPYVLETCAIWDCACGEGNLVHAWRKLGYRAIGSDIDSGLDFLKDDPPECDVIVTNPPYSLKNQFLARCYDLAVPFALLLPISALATKTRQQMFSDHGIEIVFLAGRTKFKTPTGLEGKLSNPWQEVAWFTHGLGIGQALTFARLNDVRSPEEVLV